MKKWLKTEIILCTISLVVTSFLTLSVLSFTMLITGYALPRLVLSILGSVIAAFLVHAVYKKVEEGYKMFAKKGGGLESW